MSEQMFHAILFLIFGLLSGSFFNVVGLRIPKGESIVFPGSHCTICNRNLKWYELVPVFSYLALLGKCRTCKTKISPIYPIMEAITGILFGLVGYKLGVTLEAVYFLLIVSLMMIITVSDITTYLIPDKILLTFFIALVPLIHYVDMISWKEALIGLSVSLVINLIIIFASKGKGMGGGDIKLFLLLGLVLGWKLFLITFFISVLIGLIVGLVLRIMKGMKEFPFGPSIAGATLIALFFGEKIINWYINYYL